MHCNLFILHRMYSRPVLENPSSPVPEVCFSSFRNLCPARHLCTWGHLPKQHKHPIDKEEETRDAESKSTSCGCLPWSHGSDRPFEGRLPWIPEIVAAWQECGCGQTCV